MLFCWKRTVWTALRGGGAERGRGDGGEGQWVGTAGERGWLCSCALKGTSFLPSFPQGVSGPGAGDFSAAVPFASPFLQHIAGIWGFSDP